MKSTNPVKEERHQPKTLNKTLLSVVAVALGLLLADHAQAAPKPTKISTCPFVITAPGTYLVTEDLTCSGTAITILADNVELNLNGHVVSGDGTAVGILIQGRANVSIRRGTVQKFLFSILTQNTRDNKLSNLTLQQSLNGIVGENAIGTTVTGNVATQNGDAGIIFIGDSRGNTLNHNIANQNQGAGIHLSNGGLGNIVTDNTANQNGVAGIVLGPAIDNTVARNTANENGGGGIGLFGA